MVTLQYWMLRTARQFIIEHKDIFKRAIIEYANAMPDPDKMECLYVNTPILKRIRDKFMGYLRLEDIFKDSISLEKSLYAAAWKIVICEADHDPDHRALAEWVIEELVEAVMDGEWKPREVGMPGPGVWGEPRTKTAGNYGGYHERRFRSLIGQHEKVK